MTSDEATKKLAALVALSEKGRTAFDHGIDPGVEYWARRFRRQRNDAISIAQHFAAENKKLRVDAVYAASVEKERNTLRAENDELKRLLHIAGVVLKHEVNAAIDAQREEK